MRKFYPGDLVKFECDIWGTRNPSDISQNGQIGLVIQHDIEKRYIIVFADNQFKKWDMIFTQLITSRN